MRNKGTERRCIRIREKAGPAQRRHKRKYEETEALGSIREDPGTAERKYCTRAKKKRQEHTLSCI